MWVVTRGGAGRPIAMYMDMYFSLLAYCLRFCYEHGYYRSAADTMHDFRTLFEPYTICDSSREHRAASDQYSILVLLVDCLGLRYRI